MSEYTEINFFGKIFEPLDKLIEQTILVNWSETDMNIYVLSFFQLLILV